MLTRLIPDTSCNPRNLVLRDYRVVLKWKNNNIKITNTFEKKQRSSIKYRNKFTYSKRIIFHSFNCMIESHSFWCTKSLNRCSTLFLFDVVPSSLLSAALSLSIAISYQTQISQYNKRGEWWRNRYHSKEWWHTRLHQETKEKITKWNQSNCG